MNEAGPSSAGCLILPRAKRKRPGVDTVVIPAKRSASRNPAWIPASAGMTDESKHQTAALAYSPPASLAICRYRSIALQNVL